MDMTLGFIRDMHGAETAQALCEEMEYVWNKEERNDPFALV